MKRKYETMEIGEGLEYIKSTPGVLKLFEFVALLISISCMGGFVNTMHNSKGTWNFFLFMVAASWILTVTVFLFFTLGVHRKLLSSINWALVVGIVFLIFTVLLLIAAAILADNTRNYKVSGMCDAWASVSGDIDCNNLIVSVIFGFIAFVLYSLDTLLHFWISVFAETGDVPSEETAEIKPAVSAPTNDV